MATSEGVQVSGLKGLALILGVMLAFMALLAVVATIASP